MESYKDDLLCEEGPCYCRRESFNLLDDIKLPQKEKQGADVFVSLGWKVGKDQRIVSHEITQEPSYLFFFNLCFFRF